MRPTPCPYCHKPVIRSGNRIPGHDVLICLKCPVVRIDGLGDWQELKPGTIAELAKLAAEFDQKKNQQAKARYEREAKEALSQTEWVAQ
jgi:hypothetical protein